MNIISIPKARPALAAMLCAALCAALLATALLSSCMTGKNGGPIIGSPDLSLVADGSWKGSYSQGPIKVEVEVAVAAHRIESVKILKHRTMKGKPAEAIVDSVVAAQSLQVDVVSGATGSSKCILKAIEVALESAPRG
jgi:uncharacterized protein with FMN-binding domain